MNSIVYYGNIYSLIFLLRDLILSTTPLLSKNDNELTEMYEIGLKPITNTRTTVNNMLAISYRSVLLVEYTEKSTDLLQITDKLYHI
jgi:hypothetical protein